MSTTSVLFLPFRPLFTGNLGPPLLANPLCLPYRSVCSVQIWARCFYADKEKVIVEKFHPAAFFKFCNCFNNQIIKAEINKLNVESLLKGETFLQQIFLINVKTPCTDKSIADQSDFLFVIIFLYFSLRVSTFGIHWV